jgi:hypothetical protein
MCPRRDCYVDNCVIVMYAITSTWQLRHLARSPPEERPRTRVAGSLGRGEVYDDHDQQFEGGRRRADRNDSGRADRRRRKRQNHTMQFSVDEESRGLLRHFLRQAHYSMERVGRAGPLPYSGSRKRDQRPVQRKSELHH